MGAFARLVNEWHRPTSDSMLHVTFVSNGNVFGKYYLHYEDGSVFMEADWLNGKPHGLTRTFHRGGKPMHEIHFKEDVLHGSWREWNSRGELVVETEYVDGVRVERS